MNGRERLQLLATKLRENAANSVGAKFDLGNWISIHDEANLISCSTTACAFGFAALLPEFKAEGLGYDTSYSGLWLEPEFQNHRGFSAAEAFFEISDDEAAELFSPDCYPVRKHRGAEGELAVADRIDSYLAGVNIVPDDETDSTD